jgi:hypothetical protein
MAKGNTMKTSTKDLKATKQKKALKKLEDVQNKKRKSG